jgi:CTP:molybdopterin cytidylyltransferase MocA
MNYAAVVTAGGRVDAEFANAIGTQVKALAPFAGSTFLRLTIRALRGIGVDRIAVIGGIEVSAAIRHEVDAIIAESASGAENLVRALYAWGEQTPLLYLTSDMPFITSQVLRDFMNAVPDETLAVPLTEWSQFAERFPAAPPFGVTLAGEKVVNGGAFAIPANCAARIEKFAVKFFEARKELWRMARLAGPELMLKFIFRRLDVAALESQARRLLGISAKAIRNAPAELAYDVDTLEEYRYALAHAGT